MQRKVVALKIVKKATLKREDKDIVTFEVNILRKLNHRNVVSAYGYGFVPCFFVLMGFRSNSTNGLNRIIIIICRLSTPQAENSSINSYEREANLLSLMLRR